MPSLVRLPLDAARLAFAPTRWVLRRVGVLGGDDDGGGGAEPVVRTPTPAEPVRPEVRASPANGGSAAVATPPRPPVTTPPGEDHSHVDVEVEEAGSFGPADDVGATITVAPPFDGYDQMAARDIVERLRDADPTLKAAIALYEGTHRKRATVLNAAR